MIYGAELPESLSVQIDQRMARQLKRTKRNGSKVKISVGGKSCSTLIKDLEYSTLTDEIVHISFHVLDAGKQQRRGRGGHPGQNAGRAGADSNAGSPCRHAGKSHRHGGSGASAFAFDCYFCGLNHLHPLAEEFPED